MKKIITGILILLLFSLMACGGEEKEIQFKDGTKKVVQPYGLLNKDEEKLPNVKYKQSQEAVILSVIFVETVFMPVWLIGYKLYSPVAEKE